MKSTTIRFNSSLRLAAFALLAMLISSAVFAQSQPPAPKANLIIEQKVVRFDLQGAARSWQLEVFNQPGDLIFSSGVINQPSMEWTLNDQQEKPLADGLYVYRLKFWDETGQELPAQRGHVIVNRAGSADRIWVTSNNSTGVGSASELTVVSSPDSTVGGARLQETRAPLQARMIDASPNKQETKAPGVINAVGPISGDGIAGRIAKFTGANTIDDSVMSESGGLVRVNFAGAAVARLHVQESISYAGSTGIYANNLAGLVNPAFVGAIGVHGQSAGTGSVGVKGSGQTGVYGSGVTGVLGTSTQGSGVWGSSDNASGVRGTTEGDASDAGVRGEGDSANSNGVIGQATGGYGVWGSSETNVGVRGDSSSGSGVYGNSFTGRGVYGNSNSNHGVQGRSQSQDHAGVYGYTTSVNGVGVLGEAPGGSNQTSIGVYGIGSGWGVVGVANEVGHGVAGYGSFLGASIYGASGAAWAGFFDGDVVVEGNLQVNNNFGARRDHPLDPANKYLNQSFVESSEMTSVQTGNVTTDANGEAVVSLPEYFGAMSGDFRYQLTVVGQFAQAIVAQKIEANRFTIKTDKPNVEVSWQVTGLRQNKTNRKPAEELKSETERGHYLNPAAFGQPEEKSIQWARNPEMMKRMKAERQSQTKQR